MVVDELKKNISKLKVIKDPVYGNVPLSYIDSLILSSMIFNRLHNIRQNGLAYMVYPGAITTRFLHSIGVMHLATKCLMYSFANAKKDYLESFLEGFKSEIDDILFDNVDYICEILREKICENEDLKRRYTSIEKRKGRYETLCDIAIEMGLLGSKYRYSDPKNFICDLFYSSIRTYFELDGFYKSETGNLAVKLINDQKFQELYYYLSLFALLCTRLLGLLHDLGHLPFSHCFEEILEYLHDELVSLFDDKNENIGRKFGVVKEDKLKDIKGILEEFCGKNGAKIHEIIGAKMVTILFYSLIKDKTKIKDSTSFSLAMMLASLQLVIPEIVLSSRYTFLKALKGVISSDFDVDRLDFCIRDNFFSGLDSGKCDVERILRFTNLVKKEDEYIIVPSVRTLNNIKDLLVCRLNIYKHLCMHHKILRLSRILKELVNGIIIYELKNSNKFNISNIEDNTSISSNGMNNISVIFYVLKMLRGVYPSGNNITPSNYTHIAYIFSQVDEPWLISILKRYYHELPEDLRDLEPLFDDLLGGSKNIRSLWKRSHQYKKFIEEVVLKLYPNNLEELESKIKEITKIKPHWPTRIEDKIKKLSDASFNMYRIFIEPVKNKFRSGVRKSCYLYDSDGDRVVTLKEIEQHFFEFMEEDYHKAVPDFVVFVDSELLYNLDKKTLENALAKNLLESLKS